MLNPPFLDGDRREGPASENRLPANTVCPIFWRGTYVRRAETTSQQHERTGLFPGKNGG